MKKFCVIPMLAALAIFASCQKQQTEEERKAEVERQVQDRLAAERAEAEKKRLEEERAAQLDAREKALAEREAVAAVTPAEAPTAVPVEREVVERTERTDTRETRTEERSTASYGMFYQKLDPHGEWRETNDYGYVWQPREAENSRDWRPYTEGRWAYTDAGWTWVSNERFGWATYHYGRWVKLRRIGWVWVPGDEWAPAWVSWRSSKDYVGWAPLPPEARFDRRSGIHNWADNYYDIGPEQYSFVSCDDFGAEHVRRSVVPVERNITIVFETSNVTRITFSNTTIVNEGPSYDELRSRSHRPIERYRLRRQQSAEMQARVSGGELEVSVPILNQVRNIFRPPRVKERVAEVNIDNGWTEIRDRSAAERARTKIRSEATPPPNAPPRKFVKPVELASPSATPAPEASGTPAATTASPTPAAASPSASRSRMSPTPAATATAAATASPAASAASPTPAATSPTPAATSPTPAAASPTPAATATVAASATPAMSPTPRVRPSPSIRPRPSPTIAASPATSPTPAAASPTPAATATVAASATPAMSPTPRVRPSASIRPRPSPTIAASPVATPPVAASPASTAVVASPTVPPASTPAISVAPSPRVRPSPSIPARVIQTPAPIIRQTPPSVPSITPDATVAPLNPPAVRPSVSIPPVRRPNVTPLVSPPTVPPVDPGASDTARPQVPRNVPRQTPPPRLMTPPPATTPAPPVTTPATTPAPPVTTPAPQAPPERQNDRRRPLPPVPGATPTASPSTPEP